MNIKEIGVEIKVSRRCLLEGGDGRLCRFGTKSMVESWDRYLKDEHLVSLKGAGTILVIGGTDTGKTTLITWLANQFYREGFSCAVIDADMGQSDIGPPGTIGLGEVTSPIASLGEVRTRGIFFVGSFSPRKRLTQCIVGIQRMVERARREGFSKILIDTTGFIQGASGKALKLHKVEAVDPDLVVCLQRGDECRFLLNALHGRKKPICFILPVPRGIRPKERDVRRNRRMEALRRHFQDPTVVRLGLKGLGLIWWPILNSRPWGEGIKRDLGQILRTKVLWAERPCDNELLLVTEGPLIGHVEERLRDRYPGCTLTVLTPMDFQDRIIGVMDARGETLSLGILREMDFRTMEVEVMVPKGIKGICGLKFSDLRWDGGVGCPAAT